MLHFLKFMRVTIRIHLNEIISYFSSSRGSFLNMILKNRCCYRFYDEDNVHDKTIIRVQNNKYAGGNR